MSYGGKSVSEWVSVALKFPSSCCHDAQIAAIIAAVNNSQFSFKGKGKSDDSGWHELKGGVWVKSMAHGNRLWLETCNTVHPLLVQQAGVLQATEITELGELPARQNYVKRMRKIDGLLSNAFGNRVHKLLKRMLAG